MKRWKKVLVGFVAFLLLVGGAGWIIYGGGRHEGPGTIRGAVLPAPVVAARDTRQKKAAVAFPEAERPTKQILFGDLHVHTTFSADAFLRSLPLTSGEGAHPPADACDYARYCSSLDFFALTDHAESLTPAHWRESVASIRQCNAVAGDAADPDLVAFMGYEWSQVGPTPEEHYGHKNVIFHGIGENDLPARPIAAAGAATAAFKAGTGISKWTLLQIPIRDFSQRQRYLDLAKFAREMKAVDDCPTGVPSPKLPADCRETAATPKELFAKLDQWGLDTIVIPHGSTWGFYTPPGYTWDKQLHADQRSDKYQNLIEVYSGHGNSEQYRPWRAVVKEGDQWSCPAPSDGYEPCCWRAGELIRERCDDPKSAQCEKRVAEARHDYVYAGVAGRLTVPGATVEDWRDCGQCRDCFAPTFTSRPGGSVQYILARGGFDDPSAPVHERFGFIGSSDNHSARPGTGYKEYARRKMTEAGGPRSEAWRDRVMGAPEAKSKEPRAYTKEQLLTIPPFQLLDIERQGSFFMTGGLVALHSEGRSRDAIWSALKRREVYGTSGPRILLWFDLTNGPDGIAPMGSLASLPANPHFVVRAAGAYKQKPGCPADTAGGLSPERFDRLCAGECYNPGDERLRIERIEVVRIRPQVRDDEPIAPLIEDTWKSFDCPGTDTCRVEFDDPDFLSGGRDVVYYVRAIQEPTPAVNGGNLRCADAECKTLAPCYGDYRTPYADDCLADIEERAWSSPIFLHPVQPAAPADAGVAP